MDVRTWEDLKLDTLDKTDLEHINGLIASPPKLMNIDTYQLPSGKIVRVKAGDPATIHSLDKVEEN